MNDTDDMYVVAERFDAYREAYDGGESLDSSALAAGLTSTQRAKFASLVDTFLAKAPRRPFDPQAFDRSRTADAVERSLRRAARDRNPD